MNGDSNYYYNDLDIKRINFDGAPNLSVIGKQAFYNCESLESLNIPDTITEIGEEAFTMCYSLKTVIVPGSVITIGDYAFDSCGSTLQNQRILIMKKWSVDSIARKNVSCVSSSDSSASFVNFKRKR